MNFSHLTVMAFIYSEMLSGGLINSLASVHRGVKQINQESKRGTTQVKHVVNNANSSPQTLQQPKKLQQDL
jgi:hypothetical protein